MEKLQSITIENNEQYLRQIFKKVNITDSELHNNIVVLQNYCMQNDVMAMAAVQLGIPKRIVYVKNTNLEELGCGRNQITSINLSTCPDLTYLSVSNNNIGT